MGFVQGRASPSAYFHSSVWWCTEAISFPFGCITRIKCITAKLQEAWVVSNNGIIVPLGYFDSVQSNGGLGRIVELIADGITWKADPRHAELISKIVWRDRPISYDTWSQRQAKRHRRGGTDGPGSSRSVSRQDLSPATDKLYRSSAVIWLARCINHRTLKRWDWRSWLDFSEGVRGWSGWSCERQVNSLGVTPKTLAGSEPWRVLLIAHCSWVAVPRVRDTPWLLPVLLKWSVVRWWVRLGKCLVSKAFSWDGTSMFIFGWPPQVEFAIGSGRGFGRVKHIGPVFLWVQAFVIEDRVTLDKKPTLTKTSMQQRGWIVIRLGMKFQSVESRLTLEACLSVSLSILELLFDILKHVFRNSVNLNT